MADNAKNSEWKLQASDIRRRYLRRGSKTSCMLRIPSEIQESMRDLNDSAAFSVGTASTVSSTEFSLPSPTRCSLSSKTCSMNGQHQVQPTQADDRQAQPEQTREATKLAHIAMLTSALATATLDTEDQDEQDTEFDRFSDGLALHFVASEEHEASD